MTLFSTKPERIKYTDPSVIGPDYTDRMNAAYSWMARGYDAFMTLFPLWKGWIKSVIPHIEGQKILEVSFGSGYLITQYANPYCQIYGIDYNQSMVRIASQKMLSKHIDAQLIRARVEDIPFPDNTFDTIINTMAFTAYSNGDKAMSEFKRVLKTSGKLLLVDVDYPPDQNLMGCQIVRCWEKLGDVIKDINSILTTYGFEYVDYPIGGFGSVHLFVAQKVD